MHRTSVPHHEGKYLADRRLPQQDGHRGVAMCVRTAHRLFLFACESATYIVVSFVSRYVTDCGAKTFHKWDVAPTTVVFGDNPSFDLSVLRHSAIEGRTVRVSNIYRNIFCAPRYVAMKYRYLDVFLVLQHAFTATFVCQVLYLSVLYWLSILSSRLRRHSSVLDRSARRRLPRGGRCARDQQATEEMLYHLQNAATQNTQNLWTILPSFLVLLPSFFLSSMTRVHFSLASAVGSVVTIHCSFEANDVASQGEEKGDGEMPCAGDCSPTLCTFLFSDDGKLPITSGEGTVL